MTSAGPAASHAALNFGETASLIRAEGARAMRFPSRLQLNTVNKRFRAALSRLLGVPPAPLFRVGGSEKPAPHRRLAQA